MIDEALDTLPPDEIERRGQWHMANVVRNHRIYRWRGEVLRVGWVLAYALQPLTAKQIADYCGFINPRQVMRALKKLEADGRIRRGAAPRTWEAVW